MSESDADLVLRARGGDLSAYAALMARYRVGLGRHAVYMLGHRLDAEEVVQDAFIRAYRSLDRCEQPHRFGAWLFQILVNRCRTMRGRTRRRERLVTNEPAAEAPQSHDAAESIAWRDELARALGRLPADQREAFLLHHVEGMSYEEMRALTGARESALRMRVKRAADRLRAMLRDVYVG